MEKVDINHVVEKKVKKRAKYPSCRPTPAGCKKKGKGKTWGKTK